MSQIGILFDIDELGGGFYGYASYKIFFGALDTSQLLGSLLRDGDTRATLQGRARHCCIAVEFPDESQIDSVKNALSKSTAKGLLPSSSRFLEDALVRQEPLVFAGCISSTGELTNCETNWVKKAWEETRGFIETPQIPKHPSGGPTSPSTESSLPRSHVIEEILEWKRKGRLVVFIGAGVSCVAPTSLPTWWNLQKKCIEALLETASALSGNSVISECGKAIFSRQDDKTQPLPPEYVAEILANRFPTSYFRVLQCLDSDTPNEVHLTLAALAKAGQIKAIVTTNYDRAIEAAFAAVGSPLVVSYTEEHFQDLAADPGVCGREDSPCHLLKLHGSAQEPRTLIDTLAQRKVGFSVPKTACVRHLLKFGRWLFLGYSGADLEAEANYLYLRGDSAAACGFTWLVKEGSNPTLAVIKTAKLYGDRAHILFGTLPEWTRLLTENISAPPVRTSDDRRQESSARSNIAEHTTSWARERGALWCATVLSDILQASGLPGKALELLRTCESEVAEVDKLSDAFGAFCDSIGSLLAARGNYPEAIEYFGRALHAIGDPTEHIWLSVTWHNISASYARLGDWDKAFTGYETALAISDRFGDLQGRAAALVGMGNLNYARGNLPEAYENFESSLRIHEQQGNEMGRATLLNNLSQLHLSEGRSEIALGLLDDALKIRERLGDAPGHASTLENIAHVKNQSGRHDEAIALLCDARAIREKLDDWPGIAKDLNNIGLIFQMQGRYDASMESFTEALRISELIRELPLKATLLLNIAAVKFHKRQFKEALELLRKSGLIQEELGNKKGLAKVLTNTADVYIALSNLEEAERFYYKALTLWEGTGDVSGKTETHFNLGVFYLEHCDEPSRALPHFEIAAQGFAGLRSPLAEEARRAIRDCLTRFKGTRGG